MSLLSKARDFLLGLISFTSVNVRRENLITARSVPWLSSGYASFSPAGRPTSPTMNPSTSTPSQNEILPLLRLDGTPQTLEGSPYGGAVYAYRPTVSRSIPCSRTDSPPGPPGDFLLTSEVSL